MADFRPVFTSQDSAVDHTLVYLVIGSKKRSDDQSSNSCFSPFRSVSSSLDPADGSERAVYGGTSCTVSEGRLDVVSVSPDDRSERFLPEYRRDGTKWNELDRVRPNFHADVRVGEASHLM